MQPNDITFFQRFQDDILAGRKTITIRDESESHFKTGDVLRVGRFEDDGYFCTIEVTAGKTCRAGEYDLARTEKGHCRHLSRPDTVLCD